MTPAVNSLRGNVPYAFVCLPMRPTTARDAAAGRYEGAVAAVQTQVKRSANGPTARFVLAQAGIPKMRQWLVMGSQVKQYDREFMRGIAAVIADAEPLSDLDL